MGEKVSVADWLTVEYFNSLFQRTSPGDGYEVKRLDVQFAEEERIHGNLVRAVVDLDTTSGNKTLSYIVKTGNGAFFETPSGVNMFRIEILMLEKIIPAMEKLLKEMISKDCQPLAPRLIDGSSSDKLFIMTEDLASLGFKTIPRQDGLDQKHSLAYVKHLATFHAASVAVLDQFQPELSAIPLFVDSKETQNFNTFLNNSTRHVISEIETWENSAEYLEKIRKICEVLPARLAEANRFRLGKLNVICHGDMFSNNILFRSDEQGLSVRLVDFQLSRIGSFADDITGFVHSCLNEETSRDHWENIVEEYRKCFNSVLVQLGLADRQLSQEDVKEEFHKQRAVTFFGAFHMLPHTLTPGKVDKLGGEAAFSNPKYKRMLRQLIERFQRLGWLDD